MTQTIKENEAKLATQRTSHLASQQLAKWRTCTPLFNLQPEKSWPVHLRMLQNILEVIQGDGIVADQ
jgi:hypothetical protein